MRSTVVLLALVLTGCSAGTPADRVQPRGTGHGGVEDVLKVLEEQRAPCAEPTTLGFQPGVEEQHTSCVFDGRRVDVHHFVDVAQADAFRGAVLGRGDHGVFSQTFAVVTPDAETARRLSGLLVVESLG